MVSFIGVKVSKNGLKPMDFEVGTEFIKMSLEQLLIKLSGVRISDGSPSQGYKNLYCYKNLIIVIDYL